MRIADVAQFVSPTSGGIRTYLRAKAAWAARRGVSHTMIVPRARAGVEALHGSRVVGVRGFNARAGYRLIARPGPVVNALDHVAPHVVLVHDALAFPTAVARWARRRGVPTVAFCHSDLRLGAHAAPEPARRAVARALCAVQRRGLARADAVVVASRSVAEAIAPHLDRPPLVCPLGVDVEPFASAAPDPALRRAFVAPEAPLLVHVGRLSRDKRVDLLVPTLAALPGATMVVAGPGPCAGALRREARRAGCGDRLRILGHVAERGALASLVATADCVVQPNPEEPYGLASLEALAAGARVVAPRTGGAGETLAGRGATLVAPNDPAALADGVRRALAAPRPTPLLDGLDWEHTFATEWGLYTRLTGGSVPRTVANLEPLRATAPRSREPLGA